MPKYPYRVLGSLLDRIFRNNINDNFKDIQTDFEEQKTRVDNLIISNPQPSEVQDARGGFPVLRDRLNKVDTDLAESVAKLSNITLDLKSEYNLPVYNDGLDIDTALASAFSKLSSGGKILIPKGKYYASPISVPSNIIIQGSGQETTTLVLKNGANTNFITFDQAAFSGINNMTIDANKNGQTAGSAIAIKNSQAIGKDNSRNLDIYMLRIMNAKEHGIYIPTALTWIYQLRQIKIDNCNGYGVYNLSTDNSYYGIDVFACQQGGIFEGGKNNRWIGGKLYVNGSSSYPNNAGFTLSGARRVQVVGIEVQDDKAHGFLIKDSYDCTLTGILADGNSSLSQNNMTTTPPYADGINVVNSRNIIIQGTSSSYIPCQRRPITIDSASYKITVMVQGEGNNELSKIDSTSQINIIDTFTQSTIINNLRAVGVPYVKKDPYFTVNDLESVPSFSTLDMTGLTLSYSGSGTQKKLILTTGDIVLANKWTVEWEMEFSSLPSGFTDFGTITFGDATTYRLSLGSAFGYTPAMYVQSATYTAGVKLNENVVANKIYKCSLVRTSTTLTFYVNGVPVQVTSTVNEPASGISTVSFQAQNYNYSYVIRNVLVSSKAKPSYEINGFVRDDSTLIFMPLQSDLKFGKGVQTMLSESALRLKSPAGKSFKLTIDDSGVQTWTQV